MRLWPMLWKELVQLRRWPAALPFAPSRHSPLEISINAWHLPDYRRV